MTTPSSLRFACPHCEQHIECDPALAGTDLACPTCGKPIHLPEAVNRGDPEPIPASTANGTNRRRPMVDDQIRPAKTTLPPWVGQAASYSVIAPITAFVLLAGFSSIARTSVALLGLFLILSGGVLGMIAVIQLFRHGGKGLVKAVAGTTICLFLVLAIVVPAMRKASARYHEIKQQNERLRQQRR
jgi:hypothetical protein